MNDQTSEEVIELRVDDIAQLFHTLDPFPFRERDLDREAEEYIIGWARELAGQKAIRIRIHHPDTDLQVKAALELREAFRHYFADRAEATQRDINELFRIGRRSLAIGLAILITCLLVAHFVVGAFVANPLRRLLEESLLILGWVANWRPLEIFLYDWWPLVRRRDLYRRLSQAIIESRPRIDERSPASGSGTQAGSKPERVQSS
ncbi:hypothetical protein [Bradyrhizobium japonicum]|uniref:hypothetical protein n=1 Tax=Bradyrhizobium japonicum TaxID=375 RepID=UPI00041474A1|nr:hypothetical protein [Bradyrhizobium japonicum]